jgi:hypothetical protein
MRAQSHRGARTAKGVVLLAALCAALVAIPGSGDATQIGGRSPPPGLVFRLSGPNDGEPINSRAVPLKLVTNALANAALALYVDDVYIQSRSLSAGTTRDPETGQITLALSLDVDEIQERLALDIGSPLRVTAYLYNSQTLRIVTYSDWQGTVPRPRLEVVKTPGSSSGPDLGPSTLEIETLPGDAYLFVVWGGARDLLALSPENPRLLREGRILLGRAGDVTSGRGTKCSMTWNSILPAGVTTGHLVLWTYSPEGGWRRSRILPVPMTP